MIQLGRGTWSMSSCALIVCCTLVVAGLDRRVCAAAEPSGPDTKRAATLKGRVDQRRRTQRLANELSPAGRGTFDALCEESQRLGRLPSLTEFTAVVEWSAAPLESDGGRDDYQNLWMLFVCAQETGAIKAKILADLRQMREAIRSLRVRYNVEETRGGKAERVLHTGDFAWQGNEFFFECSPGRAEGIDREIEAFDGEVVRSLRADSDSTTGSIQKLDYPGRFFDRSRNPLILAGLADNKKFEVGEPFDFVKQIESLVVYETHETIEGMECVVLGLGNDRYYLCPAFGHALVGYDSGPTFDKEAGRLIAGPNQGKRRNTGLTNYGEGIWLPDRLEETHHKAGELKLRRVVEITRWQVNEKQDHELFRDVIPVGTEVADGIRGEAYKQK
jgi:hypothetical protein